MITCTFENGNKASLRHVTVNGIITNDKNHILLVKRAAHLTNGGLWGLPGGFLDRDESTQVGVLRELMEETGYSGKVLYLFHIIDKPDRPKEDRQNVEFRYVIELTGGKPNQNSEVDDIHWFVEKDLPSEEEFAFDHRRSVEAYYAHINNPLSLPLFNY